MLDFVKEALDKISISVEVRAKSRQILAVRHGLDVGKGAARGEALAQRVAVIGAVCQKVLTLDKRIEHIAGAASSMGLAFGQL